MIHKWFLWGIASLFLLGMVACTPSTTEVSSSTEAPISTSSGESTNASVDSGVLKVAASAAVTTWDPVASFSTEALYMANIYEQLLRINPPYADEPFTPLLAKSWEVSSDGLAWTFYLRPGVTFHDGEPLTAEAVKLSLEAAAARGGASFIWAPLTGIEVIDNLTVRINLSYAAPLNLVASSLYGAWIVSPKALTAVANDPTYFDVGLAAGTGPYQLKSYTPDAEVVLTRYDNYWGGWSDTNHFNEIQISIISDPQKQQDMLTDGEVDLALRLPEEAFAEFSSKANYQVLLEPAFFNYVGFFNTLRPPLDNPKVRQALAYAIPYDEVIKAGVLGYGSQSRGPVPAGLWPYSADVKQYTYDPGKARQLLTEAGYPGGGFSLHLTYAAENAVEAGFAPVIKTALAAVGVEVTIEAVPFSEQWAKAKADPENAQDIFLLLYWPTYSDAGTDNLAAMFRSSESPSFNLSYWKNDSFDQMLDEAAELTVTDHQRARQLYQDAMNLLVDESPGLFFFDTQANFVVPKYIQGFEYNLNYPFATFFYPLSRK